MFEISEWLMMKLKQRPRLAGDRRVPAARIPSPIDALLVEPVTDRLRRLDGERLGDIIAWRQRPKARKQRIDGIAVRRHGAVLLERALVVELGDQLCGGIVESRRARANQQLMIEKRTAERSMMKMVHQRVILGV